jgi:signal transduction histidine kinase
MPDRLPVTRTFALLPLEGSWLKRYGVALLAMTVALAFRSIFQPVLGGSMQWVSISAPTVFAAWYCGLWPAALSTILGTLAANALFLTPYRPLGPSSQKDIIGELLFLGFCAAIIALGEAGRRNYLRLGRAHEMLLRSRTQLKFRVRQRTAQLQQTNGDLRDLSVRLLRVQDDERRRIARDLHDSTGQALTALKLELAGIERELAVRNPQIARRLSSTIETARLISDELRTISYLLHPPLLDELGLASALRWYVDGFGKRSGIAVHLDFRGEGRLAPEFETALFRVVQECLINIHRHSGSATASIRLSYGNSRIVLEVQDEGRGMSAEELSEISSGAALGVGLRGMRERIKDLGGEMEILSSGRGTTVKAIIAIEAGQSKAFAAPPESAALTDVPAADRPGVIGAAAKSATVN